MSNAVPMFYPCVMSESGHIDYKVSQAPMTRENAVDFLKTYYLREWRNCEAIPQSVSHKFSN